MGNEAEQLIPVPFGEEPVVTGARDDEVVRGFGWSGRLDYGSDRERTGDGSEDAAAPCGPVRELRRGAVSTMAAKP